MSAAMVCPECGEPVVHKPPTALAPAGVSQGEWSHLDGSPSAPVIGPAGYQPATPVTRAEFERRS